MNDLRCELHKLIADVAVFSGENRVALVRYPSGSDGQTGWFLPDDELTHLEHPEDAARRLLAGQLGLIDVPLRLDHIESFRGNDRSWHLVFHYASNIETPSDVVPSNDLAAFAWFPLQAMPERADVAHHGWALDIVEKIRRAKQQTGDTNG